jgi:hypothetical protein
MQPQRGLVHAHRYAVTGPFAFLAVAGFGCASAPASPSASLRAPENPSTTQMLVNARPPGCTKVGEVTEEDGNAAHTGSIDRAREAAFRDAVAMGATNVETNWNETGGDGTARAVFSGIAYFCPAAASSAPAR